MLVKKLRLEQGCFRLIGTCKLFKISCELSLDFRGQ
jgi:hypothetical protein